MWSRTFVIDDGKSDNVFGDSNSSVGWAHVNVMLTERFECKDTKFRIGNHQFLPILKPIWPNQHFKTFAKARHRTIGLQIKCLLSKAFIKSNENHSNKIPNLSGKLISYCMPLEFYSHIVYFFRLLGRHRRCCYSFSSRTLVCLSETHAVAINPFGCRRKSINYVHQHIYSHYRTIPAIKCQFHNKENERRLKKARQNRHRNQRINETYEKANGIRRTQKKKLWTHIEKNKSTQNNRQQ